MDANILFLIILIIIIITLPKEQQTPLTLIASGIAIGIVLRDIIMKYYDGKKAQGNCPPSVVSAQPSVTTTPVVSTEPQKEDMRPRRHYSMPRRHYSPPRQYPGRIGQIKRCNCDPWNCTCDPVFDRALDRQPYRDPYSKVCSDPYYEHGTDISEDIIYQARSRNEGTRPITGAMEKKQFMDKYFREELDNAENSVWWGNHEY